MLKLRCSDLVRDGDAARAYHIARSRVPRLREVVAYGILAMQAMCLTAAFIRFRACHPGATRIAVVATDFGGSMQMLSLQSSPALLLQQLRRSY